MKITVTDSRVLLEFLQDKLQIASKTKVRKLLQNGQVLVNGNPVQRADLRIEPGQVIEIDRSHKSPTLTAPFPILFEDSSLIVVEKPIGILSMSSHENKSDTFLYALNQYLQKRSKPPARAYLVHRLDREASGIMVFAFTPEIKRHLQEGWDQTEKLYFALVEGHPPKKEGTIQSWLKENRSLIVYSTTKSPDAKYAVTHYRVIEEYPAHSLLEVRLETGRKNQIRVHLSDLGCPIVGDEKYGAKGDPIHRLGLHAFSFTFNHPITGQRIHLETPIPSAFDRIRK